MKNTKSTKVSVTKQSLGLRENVTLKNLSQSIAKLNKSAITATVNYVARRILKETKNMKGELVLTRKNGVLSFAVQQKPTVKINPANVFKNKTNQMISGYKNPAKQAVGIMEMMADTKFATFVENMPDKFVESKTTLDMYAMYNNMIKDAFGKSKVTEDIDRELAAAGVDTTQRVPKEYSNSVDDIKNRFKKLGKKD
jgi:hypothetical protein